MGDAQSFKNDPGEMSSIRGSAVYADQQVRLDAELEELGGLCAVPKDTTVIFERKKKNFPKKKSKA